MVWTRFRVLDYSITRFRVMSIVFLKLFNIFSSYPQNVRIFNKNRTRTPTGSEVFLLLYGAKRTRKRNIIILLHYIEETHTQQPTGWHQARNGYRMTGDRTPNRSRLCPIEPTHTSEHPATVWQESKTRAARTGGQTRTAVRMKIFENFFEKGQQKSRHSRGGASGWRSG